MFYFLSVRLGRRLPALQKGLLIDQPYRSFSFLGSTSDILAVFFNPPACMHIIDNHFDSFNPNLPTLLKEAVSLSNIERIVPESEKDLPNVFINEPWHDWCYYYQKAELARQQKDWKEIINIDRAAIAANEKPNDPIELFPFIEAYANLDKMQTAIEYSIFVHQNSPKSDQMQCALWENIIRGKPLIQASEEVISIFFNELRCR
jgi:hypothetical protein